MAMLDLDDLDRVESLFHEALAMPPEVDRLEWLEAQCKGDPALFREVLTLLEAHGQQAGAAEPAELPAAPSALFGAYRAVRLLGRGGMSAVYLAERADGQFQQTVALKIMAGYLADREFFRRFETERQFLAALNHHNITRLLDGGISSGGDPFLITEYVDGQTIDRYCEERKLGLEARLGLFLQVCEAVDYAHRNLILHRDLKPANILVNTEGLVKLLDFGTASLIAGAQKNPTITRLRMMTPRYASPEQLRKERVNIATDVFSLGVVLYELLTGAWPFGDPHSIMRELDRTAGYITAKPPSATITEEAARARSVSRDQLSRVLKGDLSAIVLKALESDPARRYQSVHTLAADLENFLAGRPVAARLQTGLYRTAKFLRRRWLPASAAAVFILGLAAAALIAVHQAQVARAEALKAQKVNQFLNDMLSSPTAFSFDPQKFTVAKMLEAAEARLEKNWTGDPRTEATLHQSLGFSDAAILRFDRAKQQLEKALPTFQALGDEKEAARTLYGLAYVAMLEGRSADAVRGFEQVLQESKRLGKDAPPFLIFEAKDRLSVTFSLLMNRRLPEARAYLDEAIALGNRDSSIPRVSLATAMSHRAGMLNGEQKFDEAEAMLRNALAIGRQEDPDGVWQADPLYELCVLIARKDRVAAVQIARQRYELLASHLGQDNAQTAIAKIMWVRGRAAIGLPGDAPADVLEAMQVVRKDFPAPSMDRWVALSSSAHVLNHAKRFKEAESLAREMLPIIDANHLPDNDARRAESLFELGAALHGEKKEREAAAALKTSAAIYAAAGRPNNVVLAKKLLRETAK
jgi:eukaryotic-like serine/threonine-protein kinase